MPGRPEETDALIDAAGAAASRKRGPKDGRQRASCKCVDGAPLRASKCMQIMAAFLRSHWGLPNGSLCRLAMEGTGVFPLGKASPAPNVVRWTLDP